MELISSGVGTRRYEAWQDIKQSSHHISLCCSHLTKNPLIYIEEGSHFTPISPARCVRERLSLSPFNGKVHYFSFRGAHVQAAFAYFAGGVVTTGHNAGMR